MTCTTCYKLTAGIARAERRGETEKVRVKRVLLERHQAKTCAYQLYRRLWRRAEVRQ